MPYRNTEIDALIRLLDDPDDEIFKQVKTKIISLGNEVIPSLESAWEISFDNVLQKRLENIIHQIQFQNCAKRLTKWAYQGGEDLLEGVIIIAQYQYPDLDVKKIKKHIEQLRNDVWLELTPELTALETVKIINHTMIMK